jgi:DNA gyrase inhibitor GyrI
MEKTIVKSINLNTPLTAVGKSFTGDYAKSPQFVKEVQEILSGTYTPFIQNKVLGVYYDNPEKTKSEELRCFQGVFLEDERDKFDPSLSKLTLSGNYLYTKVSGDPSKIIYEGYNAIFRHIQENGIALKSSAGYQVSTFENDVITIEIYMEVL